MKLNLLQKSIICLVRLYQKKAPVSLRQSCRYTPSCSNYMILSVIKYGAIKGSLKGISRILRCHSPNGGIDYP
jgi:putative membrane protein insertion efficiency factor